MYRCYYCPQRFDTADDRDDHSLYGHRDAPIGHEPIHGLKVA